MAPLITDGEVDEVPVFEICMHPGVLVELLV